MRPEQLADLRVPSDPRLHPDGRRVAFVVTRPDREADRNERRIWLWDGEAARPLTAGPDDHAPRWSPDGNRLAFLRRGPDRGDPAQVAILPLAGGEAETVTSFPLGVGELAWSPDGEAIAVVATTWSEAWEGLDDAERARRPRRLTRLPYRADGRGPLDDRHTHVWLVDPSGRGEPRCLTPGEYDEQEIAWSPDGAEIVFLGARHPGRGLDPGIQVWSVPAAGGDATALTAPGRWSTPSFDRAGRLHVVGLPDVWSHPDVLPLWRREPTGEWTCLTGDVDRNLVPGWPATAPAGPRWLDDGTAFCTLEDGGRVGVVRILPDGGIEEIVGGERVVTGVDPRRDGTAAAFVASTPTDPGELWWWENGEERPLTALHAAFRATARLVAPRRFTFTQEGFTIEGWVYLPPGDEQVPLLLNIHGGPASRYGYGFFDEFQVYVEAGYGVVAVNPRGSSGYGAAHVRAIVGTWDEELPPDLRDLLAAVDVALARFPRLDPARMGVMGGSYGGFATVRVLAADGRFRSAVAERGLYAWSSFVATSDIGPWFGRTYLEVDPPEGWPTLWTASPLAYAHRITTPTLVIHAEEDLRCPVEQGEQLFALLWRRGVATELLRFPGEGHELSRSGSPRHREERFAAILEWHGRHLGP